MFRRSMPVFSFFDILILLDGSTGWICGEYLGLPHYASVFKTTNGGTTWTEEPLGTDETMQGIFFTDELNGWTVGNNGNNDGAIYHTTDGGNNWTSENATGILSLSKVFFINQTRGWAVGYLGEIASTFAGFDVGLRVYLEGPYENSIYGNATEPGR